MATIRHKGAVSRRMDTSEICRALGQNADITGPLTAHMLAEGILLVKDNLDPFLKVCVVK